MLTRCNECGKGFDSPDGADEACPECVSRWNVVPPEPSYVAALWYEQGSRPRCIAKDCTEQATVISLTQNGITFWCQGHNPDLVAAEWELFRGNVSGLQREERLQQLVDELRGSI